MENENSFFPRSAEIRCLQLGLAVDKNNILMFMSQQHSQISTEETEARRVKWYGSLTALRQAQCITVFVISQLQRHAS